MQTRKVKQIVKQTPIVTKRESLEARELALKSGVPGETRTHDPLLRSKKHGIPYDYSI